MQQDKNAAKSILKAVCMLFSVNYFQDNEHKQYTFASIVRLQAFQRSCTTACCSLWMTTSLTSTGTMTLMSLSAPLGLLPLAGGLRLAYLSLPHGLQRSRAIKAR